LSSQSTKRLLRKLKWRRKPVWLKSTYWGNRFVEKITGRTVVQGPFKGIRYIEGVPGCTYMPQLLGTYELEIHPMIERLLKGSFDAVVNVGAAEGHYVVGFGRAMPESRLVAFEASESGRARLASMAELNGIGTNRLEIHGLCTPEGLESALRDAERPLVIMDVDGAEDELMDPAAAPGLLRAQILVELHPHHVERIDDTIRKRFEGSHEIEVQLVEPRKAGDLPPGSLVRRMLLKRLMREHRSTRQIWFLMTPRAPSGAALA
jgi:hypothetical protein